MMWLESDFQGTAVFNLRGSLVHMRDVVAAIEAAEPAGRGLISFADRSLPFPEDMDDAPLTTAIGPVPETPLATGVAMTLAMFKQAMAEGRLNQV
jgi:UDP-glucuronate 4-epimerase